MQSNQLNPQNNQYLIVLLGDIGGTNTRLQLFNLTQKIPLKDITYKTQEIQSLEQQIIVFLKDIEPNQYPKQAHIGIAGPVIENTVLVSNAQQLGKLDGNILSQQLNIPQFIFYNDFEIASYAVLTFQKDNFKQINPEAKPIQNSVISIMGPGTGLGRSTIVPQIIKNSQNEEIVKYKVFPSEGGNIAFFAINDEQYEYYKFVREQRQEQQVILEHASTGLSLPHMYNFMKKKYGNQENLILEKDLGEQFDQKSLLKVLELFVGIFEIIVGDIIMESLCYGGIYIIGNIAYSLEKYLSNPENNFMVKYQESRKAMYNVFKRVPIYLMQKQEEMGLKGAQEAANQYNIMNTPQAKI